MTTGKSMRLWFIHTCLWYRGVKTFSGDDVKLSPDVNLSFVRYLVCVFFCLDMGMCIYVCSSIKLCIYTHNLSDTHAHKKFVHMFLSPARYRFPVWLFRAFDYKGSLLAAPLRVRKIWLFTSSLLSASSPFSSFFSPFFVVDLWVREGERIYPSYFRKQVRVCIFIFVSIFWKGLCDAKSVCLLWKLGVQLRWDMGRKTCIEWLQIGQSTYWSWLCRCVRERKEER